MTFCVVELSYFGLCKVPCKEGLQSSAVYFGDFPRPRPALTHTICTSLSSHDFPIVVNVVQHATICGTMSGNISHGLQLQVECWYEQDKLPEA